MKNANTTHGVKSQTQWPPDSQWQFEDFPASEWHIRWQWQFCRETFWQFCRAEKPQVLDVNQQMIRVPVCPNANKWVRSRISVQSNFAVSEKGARQVLHSFCSQLQLPAMAMSNKSTTSHQDQPQVHIHHLHLHIHPSTNSVQQPSDNWEKLKDTMVYEMCRHPQQDFPLSLAFKLGVGEMFEGFLMEQSSANKTRMEKVIVNI